MIATENRRADARGDGGAKSRRKVGEATEDLWGRPGDRSVLNRCPYPGCDIAAMASQDVALEETG